MAFTPKDWRNAPDLSTRLNAEALEDLELRLAGYTDASIGTKLGGKTVPTIGAPDHGKALLYDDPTGKWVATSVALQTSMTSALADIGVLKGQWVNVKDPAFGAKGDNSGNDAPAIQAAIDSLGANGGTVYFPPGLYRFLTPIDLSGKRTIRLLGAGGATTGSYTATTLEYHGTTGPAIKIGGSIGCPIEHMQIRYGTEFTGTVIGTESVDTNHFSMNHCTVTGSGTSGAAILIDIDKMQVSSFSNLNMRAAAIGFRGRATDASYSNVISFKNVVFNGFTTIPMRDPGESWLIDTCTFEPLSSGKAGAMDYSAITFAQAVVFLAPWMGDITAGPAAWVKLPGLKGFACIGGRVTSNDIANGTTFLDVGGLVHSNGRVNGVHISGVDFDRIASVLTCGSAGAGRINSNINIQGNAYLNGTVPATWATAAFPQDDSPRNIDGRSGTLTATYGATVNIDHALGRQFKITVTNATAFTIANPTNAHDEELTIDIVNASGGVMGAVTFGANFKPAGAFTVPANGKRRTIKFYWDGTNYVELHRAAADI